VKKLLLALLVSASLLLVGTSIFAQDGDDAVLPLAQVIEFEPGATSAQVSGQVAYPDASYYQLDALAGQTMEITLTEGTLTVVSPSGSPLVRGTVVSEPVQHFELVLPESGFYQIDVNAFEGETGAVDYTMTVSITGEPSRGSTETPERIRFQPGGTGAVVTGTLAGGETNSYLVNAFVSQQMTITVDAGALTVVSPSGEPLLRGTVTDPPALNFDRALPETGDYIVQVSAPADSAPLTYLLTLSITGDIGGSPTAPLKRIEFAVGATSAQLTDDVTDTEVDTYLLEAFSGQTLMVSVTNAYLTLVSPSGEPLARAQNGAHTADLVLPESGDYVLQISVPVPTPQTSYTLDVSVTGTPERNAAGERIRFQTGATNAQITGEVRGSQPDIYLLRASAGQSMNITLSDASLTVVSPGGIPMVRGNVTEEPVEGLQTVLPETGDYQIQVTIPVGSAPVRYTLDVTVQ
jgi:hypothetical protein